MMTCTELAHPESDGTVCWPSHPLTRQATPTHLQYTCILGCRVIVGLRGTFLCTMHFSSRVLEIEIAQRLLSDLSDLWLVSFEGSHEMHSFRVECKPPHKHLTIWRSYGKLTPAGRILHWHMQSTTYMSVHSENCTHSYLLPSVSHLILLLY